MVPKARTTQQRLLFLAFVMTCIVHHTLGEEPMGGGQYRNEIRNALHTINNHIRIVHDKLERHEAREHQHGEVLRRLLEAQDKRQRTSLDALNKLTLAVRELAEQAELAQTDTRRRSDALKTRVEALTRQANSDAALEKEALRECQSEAVASRKALLSSKGAGDAAARALAETLGDRLDSVTRVLDKVTRTDAETTRSATTALAAAEQRIRAAAEGTEALLLTYNKRLDSFRPTPASPQSDWHTLFLGALEVQGQELKKVGVSVSAIKRATDKQEDLAFSYFNDTMNKLIVMEQRLSVDAEKAAVRLERAATETQVDLERVRGDILHAVNDLGEQVDTNADKSRQAYEEIHGQVLALRSAEKVLIQTADNVLDTKRGVEYGVYQILQETGEGIKAQTKLLNATLHQRFDGISDTILEHQTGALTNLSQKIEAEISQVWRQIGIMYQQLSASTTALDRLQEQTESYVNGSVAAMDSMEGKVGAIRERMNEVDDNLNYLLGRLSLFSSEFGQVRTGLAEALDDIRKTFEDAQEAVRRTKGPAFAIPEALPPRTNFPRDE